MKASRRTGTLVTLGLVSAVTMLMEPLSDRARAGDSPYETAKTQLREKIDEAGRFPEQQYTIQSWADLHSAMAAAHEFLNKERTTQRDLVAARAALQKAIEGLEGRKVVADTSPRIGLSASLFATDREGPVNNVALMWATAEPCDSFEMQRARGTDGEFTKIYSGQGASFNDYGLEDGTWSYKLIAHCKGKTLTSNVETITTMAMPSGLTEYSNETGGGLWEPLKIGDTYYGFPSEREGPALKAMWVETSRDGKNWKRGRVVMDRNSHPALEDYKLEAVNFFYDEKHDHIVIWAHWEIGGPTYGHGRALVATAKPGEPFKVHRVFNPLGVQVRDMSVFIDDDKQGYLVAASNVFGQGANATLYIFKLNEDYTDVTGIVNKAMEGEYREAPHIIKKNGFYYLFFSQAAGWYPSRAAYVSSKSLDGRWSDARYIGNTSTFSAQSGGIMHLGHGDKEEFVMQANRWIRGEGTSGNVMLPLHLAEGFVFADYSPTLLVNRDEGLIIPLDAGKLLSEGQPATSSIPGKEGHGVEKAFDGDYATFFESDERKWPFTVMTDLGALCKVRNVQISWHLHKGSEAYYKYLVEGSTDGKEWRALLDRTDDKDTVVSKTYGFSSDMLPDSPEARYVRINVQNAVLHNNPNNWYPPMLYEVKVYGDKAEK